MDETTSTTETGTTETAPVTSNSGSSAAGIPQEKVNELIGSARKEGRESGTKIVMEKLEKFGVKDLTALESILAEHTQRKEAEMSIEQKLTAQLEAEKSARQQAEAKAQEVERKAAEKERNFSILSAAREAKAEQPEDVIVWASANAADDLAATLKDDGTVDTAKVTALVEKAKAARPTWFGVRGGPGSPSNAGGRGVDPGKAGKTSATQHIRNMARKGF